MPRSLRALGRRLAPGLRALGLALVPGACALCGTPDPPGALCGPCRRTLPRLDEPRPPAPPPLAAWVAAAPFEGIPALLLRRFKYPAPGLAGLDPAADAVVREWILAAAARVPGTPDAILPVPLHPARLRARGFHPAGLLAAWVARAGYGPLRRGALARTRDTPSQTGLSRAARRRNVAGAFEARQALPPHVWLVDDVVTTGATLCEAARAARRAGARRVISVCALRTPR